MRLAFSTLGAPAWDTAHSLAAAAASGFDGIEWRLVDGQVIDTSFDVGRAELIGRAADSAGLRIPAVGSSIDLAAPATERAQVLRDTRRMLEIAGAMGAEFLRVFPGAHPHDAPATEWLREAVNELAPDIRGSGVRLALEVHDSRDQPGIRGRSCSAFLGEALSGLPTELVGVLWDVANPYLEGETADVTWRNIGPMLLYLHVKDMAWDSQRGWMYVNCGDGDLPLREIFDCLGGSAFEGWVSFEWEKFWVPDLDAPEIAFPRFMAYMREYLDGQ